MPTCCPAFAVSSLTTPSSGAVTVCSIFIASTTMSGCPGAHRLARGDVHGDDRARHGGADRGVDVARPAAARERGRFLGQRPGVPVAAQPHGRPGAGERVTQRPVAVADGQLGAVQARARRHRVAGPDRHLGGRRGQPAHADLGHRPVPAG